MTGPTPEHVGMDPFTEVAELLFGDGAYELVAKMSPTSSDLSTAQEKRERTQARVGLASNIVGLGAGAAGTAEAYGKFKDARAVKAGKPRIKVPKKAGKYAALGAGALLGLQVANVAGDAVANRVLARSAKKKDVVVKRHQHSPTCVHMKLTRGKLVAAAIEGGAPKVKSAASKAGATGKPMLVAADKQIERKLVAKSTELDIVWEGEFAKFDTDKRQVFGWASIVELNGEPVVDLQGDFIPADEIEKAAYEYVQKSRKGGDMHRRDGENAFHASEMIESFMVTPEKVEKMGLPPGSLPTGWWVGYQVHDDETWNLVKSGKRTGFSIHGRGKRADA